MALKPARFKLDEEISFSGKPMRVAGLVQFEGADAKTTTRYLLAGASGAPQVLEDSGDALALLRPFPQGAQPVPSGDTVTVMGEKYKLAGMRKLKLLGAAGEAPGGGGLRAPLLLSGVFQGGMGSLVREIAPGKEGQAFYSLKPVHADEVLSAEQLAAQAEAARLAAEQQAEADDDDAEPEGPGGWLKQALGWGVAILVIVGLGYACSDSDDESSGSARTSYRYSGGK